MGRLVERDGGAGNIQVDGVKRRGDEAGENEGRDGIRAEDAEEIDGRTCPARRAAEIE